MSNAHSSNRITQLLCLVLLLGAELNAHGQACLEITCAPAKTVNCDAAWAFDLPVVTNSCTCGQTNYTLTVVSTITNTIACRTQLVTQTWRVANGCASNSCSQTVTVVNTNLPLFSGATNLTINSCSNLPVAFNVTASEACCGNLVVVCSPPSGSLFPAGQSTPVHCSATDCCGQTFTNTFTITVVKTNSAVFQGVSPITVQSCGPTPVSFDPTASEACCGPLSVGCVPPSGTTFGFGSTMVTCTTTDCFGARFSTNFTVTVLRGESLIPVCANKFVVCGTSWTYDPPTIYDPCCSDTNYTITTIGPLTNGISSCGQTNSMTFIVTDQCGNSNQCSQTVTILNLLVLFPTNQIIACGSPIPTNHPAFTAGCCTNVTFVLEGITTNTSGCGLVISQVWQATDCCSNSVTVTNRVTILAGTPSIVCTGNKVLAGAPCSLGSGLTGYTVLHGFPGATGDGTTAEATLLVGSDQALYGTTSAGGDHGGGTVFKVNPDGTSYATIYNFGAVAFDGESPAASLIEGRDGFLYGTTLAGGQNGYGSIFKIKKDGTGYSKLHNFALSSSDGGDPQAGLVQASDNSLYGTTSVGGAYSAGTIFTIRTNGTFYQVLYHFGGSSTDGQNPYAGLASGQDGLLYGTTYAGGTAGLGSIFKLARNGTGYALLRSFGIADGYNPRGGLVFGANGLLFGTTSTGGAISSGSHNGGTLFTVQTNGAGYAVLHNFAISTADGIGPMAGLLVGCDQTLYGTTYGGGTAGRGTVFALRQDGSEYAVLKSFGTNDGDFPVSGLVQAGNGNLYGTTSADGSNGSGTVFAMPPSISGLFDPPTLTGGCCGTNFSISLLSTVTSNALCSRSFTRTWQILACCGQSNLCSQTVTVLNTSGPVLTCSNLTIASGSQLPTNPPAAYEPGCSNITVLLLGSSTNSNNCSQIISRTWQATDCCSNTSTCVQLVTLISPPVITCASNKTVLCTTAWSFDPPLATEAGCSNLTYALLSSNLVSATPCQQVYAGSWQVTDCCSNTSTCTQLVTVVAAPPTITCPTNKVVSLSSCPQGSILPGFTIMHSFPAFDGDGSTPQAMLLGSDQVLYGTCAFGGAYGTPDNDGGTVFKINQDGTGYSVLWSFGVTTPDATIPFAGLIEGLDGRLYGTAAYGGQNGLGALFALRKDGNGYSVLYSFGDTTSDGNYPLTALVQGSDGTLYGTTTLGGAYTPLRQLGGTAFAIQPDGSGFHVIHQFNSFPSDGITPYGPLVIGPDRALYGTTPEGGLYGGGTLFRLTTDGSSYTQLHHFGLGNDGTYPYSGLVFGTNGALFGTAIGGGSTGAGIVFTIQTNGSGYAVLYNFGSICYDGIGPNRLHLSCGGRLYATTTGGGNGSTNPSGPGTVFGLDQDGSHYSILRNFIAATDGDNSHDTLVQAPDGVLFGTTDIDGLYGSNNFGGTLFKLPPSAPELFDPPTATCGCCGTNVSIIVLGTTTNNTPSGQALTRAWVVVDCCSHSNFCSQTVTVSGTNGLVLTCTNLTITSSTNVQVFFPPPIVAGACCTNLTISCSPPSGTVFAPGTTNIIECLVSDCCGQTNACDFLVTVLPPTLQLFFDRSKNTLTITWIGGGTLESATSLTGPWTPWPTAISPYTVPATGAQQFYRIRTH